MLFFKITVLLTTFYSLTIIATAAEKIQIKTLDLRPAEQIQLKTLDVHKLHNTVTPEILGLETLSAPNARLNISSFSAADTPSTPSETAQSKTRPVPSWNSIKDNPNIRIFPILSDGKRLYVSIYSGGTAISKATEEELTQVYKQKGAPDSFEVGGRLKQELLAQMKISATESVHWFLFDERSEHRLRISEIENLLIKPNGAGDGVFGTVGVTLEGNVKSSDNSLTAVGLASIGAKSLLRPGNAVAPQWKETNAPFPTEKALDLADYISPMSTENGGSRSLSASLRFRAAPFGDIEFIEATAKFERRYGSDESGHAESLFGFFLRTKDQVATIRDFYLDTTYFNRPDRILLGKWVEGFDASLYISSTGMGDCGRLILIKNGVEPVAVPVRCGSWGC